MPPVLLAELQDGAEAVVVDGTDDNVDRWRLEVMVRDLFVYLL